MSIRDDPQHWYDRAKEARANAAGIADATAKQLMLDIANNYEALARRAAERIKTQRNST